MQRKLLVAIMAIGLIGSGTGAAVVLAKGTPSSHAKINAVQKLSFKVNRYVKDALRWQKDVYQVRSGGTITITNKAEDGPHTISVVKKGDLPRTVKQINECKICQAIGQQFGITDPNSDAPPPHNFVEDGQASDVPTNVDKPGDSAFIGPQPGTSVDLKVTAKKGTTLYFMCAIHPWMQAKIIVG